MNWKIYDRFSAFFSQAFWAIGLGAAASFVALAIMLWYRPIDASTSEIFDFVEDFGVLTIKICAALWSLWALSFCTSAAYHLLRIRGSLCSRMRIRYRQIKNWWWWTLRPTTQFKK